MAKSKCPRSGAKLTTPSGAIVKAVPIGYHGRYRSNAICIEENGETLVSVIRDGRKVLMPLAQLTPAKRVTVAPPTHRLTPQHEYGPATVNTPESSACHKEPWCVLQVGHEGPCSPTFRLSGSDDFHARNASIWSANAVEEAELGAADALDQNQCGRALHSLVRAERKTTMASTHAAQTGHGQLREQARKSNSLVNALWSEFERKCLRNHGAAGVSPFGGLGAVWTDEMRAELANLAHLARTALSDDPMRRNSRYYWHVWASREFEKLHPEVSSTAAYKELERQSAWRY